MPRRSILSATERDNLMALSEGEEDLIRHYSFTDADLSLIRQRRGDANRLGFAVQLCLLRYPGHALAVDMSVPNPVIQWVARQIQSDAAAWPQYGARDQTRREHFQELRAYLGLSAFGLSDFRKLAHSLADLAMQTDKGLVLAAHALETLRQRRIILPTLALIERACAEAVTRANRRIYRVLLEPLQPHHKRGLDNLLKESGGDPYAAIESVIPWRQFAQSVTDAAQLAQPATFDHLHLVSDHYSMLRRYPPELLDVLKLKAAPAAQAVMDAIDVVREMNATGSRKVPNDAPIAFVKARWKPLVVTDEGFDRRFYEICALSELKNALRSGDIWVDGSRQFKDFEDYLLPPEKFSALQKARALPIAINPDLDQHLFQRVILLNQQLSTVNRLALANALPDAIITNR